MLKINKLIQQGTSGNEIFKEVGGWRGYRNKGNGGKGNERRFEKGPTCKTSEFPFRVRDIRSEKVFKPDSKFKKGKRINGIVRREDSVRMSPSDRLTFTHPAPPQTYSLSLYMNSFIL